MRKGFFIAIYGVNNIGKSTHAKLLVNKLISLGLDAIYIKYPLYELEPTGPIINKILRSDTPQRISETELQTLFTQNRRDYEPQLKALLEQNKIVIAEDYTGTGIAWGAAKGLKISFIEKLNEGLLKEDLAILIKGKRDIRAREKSHIHENNDALVERVSQILDELAQRYDWKIVLLQEKIEDTFALLWKEVRLKLLL